MAQHKELEGALDLTAYLSDLRSPRHRGANEKHQLRMGHELHRDSRLVIYTVDADTRPVVALDTVDISLDRLSDADFKKAQALIEDIRHPGALKAWYRELVNNDSEDNCGYAVRLGNNNAADNYLCDVFRGAVSSAPAAVGKLDSLVRRATGLPARKI